ncbi:hypothetical protein P175DRAFT_0426331, partial [Aspergillus ochraceoroseus IBT 24754]
TGHIIQDLGPQVDRLLTVTGKDGESLLVSVDKDVYNLLEGKVSLSDSIGNIVGDAADIGKLVADLGPVIDCILTVVGEDAQILLIQLAPEVADLLRGTTATLGLNSVSNPVGELVSSLGLRVRDAPAAGSTVLQLVGMNHENLLVEIEGVLGGILSDLHLSGIVGSVIDIAIDVTKLLQKLGPQTDNLLVVVGKDGQFLLVQLAPSVANIVGSLLPELGQPVGHIVETVGNNL